jgi:hypothetical protein
MTEQPSRATPRYGLRVLTAVVVCSVAILAGWIWTQRPVAGNAIRSQASKAHVTPATSTTPRDVAPTDGSEPPATLDNIPEVPSRNTIDFARVLGQWKDEFHGERTFTFRDDGTGIMHIKLDSISRLLYGDEVAFDFAWTLKGDELHMSMTCGEPKKTAESLSQLFGKTSEKRIEKLDEHEMHLRSLDSQKLYIHRRK